MSRTTSPAGPLSSRSVERISDVDAADWNACAHPPGTSFNPFVGHAFLQALETSGCVAPERGWSPLHLLVETRDQKPVGAMPLYLKTHSYGEYVFDQAWARGYEAAGGHYYPKLLSAVPFTPVPGPRLLIRENADRQQVAARLLEAGMSIARDNDLSSLHVNFLTPDDVECFQPQQWLLREGRQFHFDNPGFASFDDYLASLNARRRKAVRKERREAVAAGLEIRRIEGADIVEAHWDAFFRFYMDTGSRKWGTPYLNRQFFSLIGESMKQHLLLVLAFRQGKPIAGALNFIGGDTLYGRYWGMNEFHPSLHFELCYYQAIEYAIERKLQRIEAGAQGEHKLARGYLPTPTYSMHYLPDPAFRAEVRRFLEQERNYIELEDAAFGEHTPFRRDEDRTAANHNREVEE